MKDKKNIEKRKKSLKIQEITSDIFLTNNIKNNNFVKSILLGAKWSKLPNNELTWTFNHGSIGNYNSIKYKDKSKNVIDFVYPTKETIKSIKTIMSDLDKIIGLTVKQVNNVKDAVISFNFLNKSKYHLFANNNKLLGQAWYPNWKNAPWYKHEQNDRFLCDSWFTAGNVYIAYEKKMNFKQGSYNYVTLLHELGHALGLAHPHDSNTMYGGTSTIMEGVNNISNSGKYNANKHPITVMTYNDFETDDKYNKVFFLGTFGPLDIYALQYLYGKNILTSKNDNVYKFSSNNQKKFWRTIVDTGGIDTIDASHINVNCIIDLNDASILPNTNLAGTKISSNIFGGLTIANGVIIENVKSGKGNDVLIGNEANNTFHLNGGNDMINGGKGFDTIVVNKNKDNFSKIIYNKEKNMLILSNKKDTINIFNCEKIKFRDSTLLVSSLKNKKNNYNNFCEWGSINISNKWKKVYLTKIFKNPVVILSDPTNNNKMPISIRLRKVDKASFELCLSTNNKFTKNELVSYFVCEIGNWKFNNELIFEVGKTNLNKTIINKKNMKKINFSRVKSKKPLIFTQIQNQKDNKWKVTRIKNVNKHSFFVGKQIKNNFSENNVEEIGWISIVKNNNLNKKINFETGIIKLSNKLVTRFFKSKIKEKPFLFTKVISFKNNESYNSRLFIGRNKFGVSLSKNKFNKLKKEKIGFFTIY